MIVRLKKCTDVIAETDLAMQEMIYEKLKKFDIPIV